MMPRKFEINIDMNKRCVGCGRPGATDNGYCLKCIADMIGGKKPARKGKNGKTK
jgi:hypothetical protein